VLVVPTSTPIVEKPATPPGSLLVFSAGDEFQWDLPTVEDPYARYCYPCGVGPGGRKTIILDYVSTDGQDKTAGYVFVTAFEEIQVGIGPDARVYRLDDVEGRAVWDPTLNPIEPPESGEGLCPSPQRRPAPLTLPRVSLAPLGAALQRPALSGGLGITPWPSNFHVSTGGRPGHGVIPGVSSRPVRRRIMSFLAPLDSRGRLGQEASS